MGLTLAVGILADLNGHDPEGAQSFRETFDSLNRFLGTENLVGFHVMGALGKGELCIN